MFFEFRRGFFSLVFGLFLISNRLAFNIFEKKNAFVRCHSDATNVAMKGDMCAFLAPLIFGTRIKTLTICHDFFESQHFDVARFNR